MGATCRKSTNQTDALDLRDEKNRKIYYLNMKEKGQN